MRSTGNPHLHEKVDHLLNRQWKRLTEIRQIQIEMMLDRPGRRIASSRCARIKRKWKKPKAPATRSCPATRRRGGVDAVSARVLLHGNIERIFRFCLSMETGRQNCRPGSAGCNYLVCDLLGPFQSKRLLDTRIQSY